VIFPDRKVRRKEESGKLIKEDNRIMRDYMKKTISLLILIFIVLSQFCFCYAEGENDIMTKPSILNVNMAGLYEASTDTWLYLKNENVTNAPASMTKVMTATLLLDFDPDMSGTTTVSCNAISEKYCYWMDDVHLLEGEECSVNDLMHYLLIASGNEAATTLAEYVAGDIDTFIGMMNARAKELGMTRTIYYDPHGLSNDSRTTVSDMMKLAQFAMENYPQIREIVGTQSGQMPVSNKRTKPIRFSTTNRVMDPRGNSHYETGFSEDIIGIKTGSTTAAGLNLSCCMVHDDLTFYSVVMHGKSGVDEYGSEYSGHHADTATLMKWARTFTKQGFAKGDTIAYLATAGSLKENVDVMLEDDVYILAQGDIDPQLEFYSLGLSVKKGDIVGKLTLCDEFGNERVSNLVAAADARTSLLPIACFTLAVAAVSFAITRKHLDKKHPDKL